MIENERMVRKPRARREQATNLSGSWLLDGRLGRWVATLLLLVLVSGCGREDVKVYRVAKESAEPSGTLGQLPAGHPEVAAKPQLTWELPAGWMAAKPGEFRVASFNIKGENGKQADVGVFPLPGGAGGDFANVNRWRGQVGLESVTAQELKELAQSVEIAGQPADLYDLSGKSTGSDDPTRILAAIQHRDGTAWFFKMTGDDQLVAQQKAAFIKFLKSVKLEQPQMAGLPPSHPPIDGSSLSRPMSAAATSSVAKPHWQVPAGWSETPGGQFLVAKFNITGKGGAQAAVNVSSSTGDGGGLLANVNRWRQQLGLSPVDETELSKSANPLDVAGGKATLVEMSGTDARTGQPARVVGAIVSQSGQTWFYKLMGDAKIVENQRETFTQFVQTVRY